MKEELIKNLHKILADLRLLTIKTQMYHWNVKSSDFYSIHKMLNKQYDNLFKYQDVVAELIRELGFFVNFDKINMDSSSLKYNNMNEKNCKIIFINLIEDNKILELNIKNTIKIAQECEEEGVVNELATILSSIQKNLWFLKSHCVSENNYKI